MTLESILSGPAVDRVNGSRHPMTEEEARHVLQQIEKQMPRKRRGAAVLKLAEFAESGLGNLSVDAIRLYRAYAAAYGES